MVYKQYTALLNVIYTAAEFLVCGGIMQASPVNATDTTWNGKLQN